MAEKILFLQFDKYKDLLLGKKVLIAVSGGVDSLSLLISFEKWNKRNNFNINIEAITVDHKLRATSTDEAQYVKNICDKIEIKHTIATWDGEKPTSNIELIAREKRYELIKEYFQENNFDILLLAHHGDDQAETFFIRLFRGSGIDGLASMNDISVLYDMKILRPFLGIHKNNLINFLNEENIKWVEDESNSDEKYLRNKIRAFLNSFENKNEIVDRINFAVKEINKSKVFINEEFEKYKSKILKFNTFGSCLLLYEKFKKINKDIALRILAFSAMKVSGNIYKPRLEKLQRLYDNIINLQSKDKFKYTFYGCVFEKYNDELLMVYREYNSIEEDKKLVFNKEIIWDNRFTVKLLQDRNDLIISHVKEGEFNKILEKTRKSNFEKYKELREIVGIQKNIFYTLPVLIENGEYILESNDLINIQFMF